MPSDPNELPRKILEALSAVRDPDLNRDIVSLGFVQDLSVSSGAVRFTIELTTPACPVKDQLKAEAERVVSAVAGVRSVEARLTARVRPSAGVRSGAMALVRNLVPVASGKGGVGKSTISANLALALAARGARVGVLDADVYGPSLPLILGIQEKPLMRDGRILPIERYGLRVMSTGFFLPPNEAVIWRGPMLHKMIQDLLGAVDWGELDYLLVDLPPGTGDVQLSLCQSVPTSGAVIVSTPQDVAWQVAQKAILMFDKLNTPVLGVIENMSYLVCGHCGEREEVFGHGGARRAAEKLGIPFLGQIPLETRVRRDADEGRPTVFADPACASSRAFFEAADKLAAQLSIRSIRGSEESVPAQIGAAGGPTIEIRWSDGTSSVLDARRLRVSCPCASCVDEFTGKKLVDPDRIDADIRALEIRPVGRYALQIVWSDGHSTGLYSYRMLREFAHA